jgi:hypothetical protein
MRQKLKDLPNHDGPPWGGGRNQHGMLFCRTRGREAPGLPSLYTPAGPCTPWQPAWWHSPAWDAPAGRHGEPVGLPVDNWNCFGAARSACRAVPASHLRVSASVPVRSCASE